MFNKNNLFNPRFLEKQIKKLPKEAFIKDDNKSISDPYIDNVFKLKPYIANNSYLCNIVRTALYENPVEQLNQVTYIDNVPIEQEDKFIIKNINNLQLLNFYRHNQTFLFINLEDIPKFYKDFKDFLDYYHMVLSTSYNYVNIDKTIVNSIESMLETIYSNYKYLINPDDIYKDNNLLQLGTNNNNSLLGHAVNVSNDLFSASTKEKEIKIKDEIYERNYVKTVEFDKPSNNDIKINHDNALPEINITGLNNGRVNSKEIKF